PYAAPATASRRRPDPGRDAFPRRTPARAGGATGLRSAGPDPPSPRHAPFRPRSRHVRPDPTRMEPHPGPPGPGAGGRAGGGMAAGPSVAGAGDGRAGRGGLALLAPA